MPLSIHRIQSFPPQELATRIANQARFGGIIARPERVELAAFDPEELIKSVSADRFEARKRMAQFDTILESNLLARAITKLHHSRREIRIPEPQPLELTVPLCWSKAPISEMVHLSCGKLVRVRVVQASLFRVASVKPVGDFTAENLRDFPLTVELLLARMESWSRWYLAHAQYTRYKSA